MPYRGADGDVHFTEDDTADLYRRIRNLEKEIKKLKKKVKS